MFLSTSKENSTAQHRQTSNLSHIQEQDKAQNDNPCQVCKQPPQSKVDRLLLKAQIYQNKIKKKLYIHNTSESERRKYIFKAGEGSSPALSEQEKPLNDKKKKPNTSNKKNQKEKISLFIEQRDKRISTFLIFLIELHMKDTYYL